MLEKEKLSELGPTSDRFGVVGGKLSEVRATSDRFGIGREKAVRTRVNFRQVWWWKRKSCQNKIKLQTGFSGKRGKAVGTRKSFIHS
ncbi:hypothetical protein J7E32_08685 [Bacillus sp. ISL-55]|nr:hypothetical protein [Bacillus sp. ISL-55]